MSVTSLSFTFVNMYSTPAAKPAAERPALPAQKEETRPVEERRPGGGPNRLVQAMMTALRELGLGSPSGSPTGAPPAAPANAPASTPALASNATPSATSAVASEESAAAASSVVETVTGSATSAAEASDAARTTRSAETLESAVHQFAHELFRALRQIGRGETSDDRSDRSDRSDRFDRSDRVDGHRGHRHHHHGHHGWRRHGYGDMSERLQALAQTFAAPAAVQSAGPATTGATVSTSISITLTVQGAQLPGSPMQGLGTSAAIPTAALTTPSPATSTDEVAQDVEVTAATPAAPAEPAKNPLLEAFSKMFALLKPQGESGAETDIASKLRTFLQTLAETMRPQSMRDIQTPQVGGLVNITA